MSNTTSLPRSHSRSRIAAICMCMFCLLCIGIFATYSLAELVSPSLSAAGIPSAYPSSQIIHEEAGGGSGGRREKTIYHTTASLNVVHIYMEAQLPGFHETNAQVFRHSDLIVDAYRNEFCNDTRLAHIVRTIIGSGFSHCASVVLYADPERPQETIIEVVIQYPSG